MLTTISTCSTFAYRLRKGFRASDRQSVSNYLSNNAVGIGLGAGVAPHRWQAASSAGISIGQNSMVVASKVIAMTAVDLFTNAQLVSAAKADFARELAGRQYHSFIPEGQTPPLDYRK